MEVFLANLAEAALAVAPEAATMSANVVGASAAEAAAAAAAAEAAAAAGVTTTGLGAIPEIATAGLPEVGAAIPEVATAAVPDAAGIMQASNNIPGVLQGAGTATPESIAASEQALAKAPYGIDLSSLTNSQAIDPTLDAAARQSGFGAPQVDLTSIANSQALDPTLSGAASTEGLGQGVNLKEMGIGS